MFIEKKRDYFEYYEKIGKEISGCEIYDKSTRGTNRRCVQNVRLQPLDYGRSKAVKLEGADNFCVNAYNQCINTLIMSLNQRISAYEEANGYFGFLRKLYSLSDEEIQIHGTKLVKFYKNDLEESLITELQFFREYSKIVMADIGKEKKEDQDQQESEQEDTDEEELEREEIGIENKVNKKEKKDKISFEARMFKLIIEKQLLEVFPNVYTLLKIYLVLMSTNCSSERSFLKLKLIKSRLRSSMTQGKLNCLTLMNAENDLLREISYSHIIDDFANKKVRKMNI